MLESLAAIRPYPRLGCLGALSHAPGVNHRDDVRSALGQLLAMADADPGVGESITCPVLTGGHRIKSIDAAHLIRAQTSQTQTSSGPSYGGSISAEQFWQGSGTAARRHGPAGTIPPPLVRSWSTHTPPPLRHPRQEQRAQRSGGAPRSSASFAPMSGSCWREGTVPSGNQIPESSRASANRLPPPSRPPAGLVGGP